MTNKKIIFFKKPYFIFFILSILIIKPAYAYGGPGVAIGAIIVLFTVIITFFASFFLTIFKYTKKIINTFINLLTKKRKKVSKRKMNNRKLK